jgi:hypothetical protein
MVKVTMKKILDLIASHDNEIQILSSHIQDVRQKQKQELIDLLTEYVVTQDSTVSTTDMLNKLKVHDLEYWYTPLSEIPGYSELGTRTTRALGGAGVYYRGDLATKTERELRLIPNFGRKMFVDLNAWLSGLGEELGQELREYRENEALLRYFYESIVDGKKLGEKTLKAHAKENSQRERFSRIISIEISTVGELATSRLVETTMPEKDMRDIESYLKQWNENLHLRMEQPYWPSR